MKKDLLTLDDISKEEIFGVLDLTEKIKKRSTQNYLVDKVVCILSELLHENGVSFEIAIRQLGGNPVFLSMRDGNAEAMMKILERYADAIIVQTISHETLESIAKKLKKPVINGLSDISHPCQTLADLFTMKEKFKQFPRIKVAYIGYGNAICNSLLLGCSKLGVDVSVACPKGFEPNRHSVHLARNYTKISKANIEITQDPKKALENSDVVYSCIFASIDEKKASERTKRKKLPSKYNVDINVFEFTDKNALFMHPLPAYRGEEVSDYVINGTRSIVFDQAENRLHVQKTLLIKIIGDPFAGIRRK